jgi:hypothetical protein
MSGSGITSPLRLDPCLTNRRYHFAKHLIVAPPGNKPAGSILAAKVAQFLTAVETGIAELAESAESESVRLRALRAILGDMMAVSKYTGLEDRVAGLEERVREQNEG